MKLPLRQTYLDWLRMLSILAVLFFHGAMPFATGETWHIRNAESSNLLDELVVNLHLFRMPLLFFISGTVSYYLLQRRGPRHFIGLRVRRLLIPLLFGMLVVVPPQVYMERLTQGFHGNFWQFYPSIFTTGPYPHGNLSWHHLWFVAYLFLYDVLLMPAFTWVRSSRSRAGRTGLGALTRGYRVYGLALPGVLWYAATARALPETNDVVHDGGFFVYWLLFVLAGFLCAAQPALLDSLERLRRPSLTLGFVVLLVFNYVRWNNVDLGALPPFLTPLAGWSLVFAAVGYGKRYLQRTHRSLAYLNQAAYPFYILHQTVLVVLAYYVVQVPHESILGKYLFLVALTFLISMAGFHLFIRPVTGLRFCFGMKPLTSELKPSPKPVEAAPAPRRAA